MATIDEIAPAYIGGQRIKLSLASRDPPRAFSAVNVRVEIDEAADADRLARTVGLTLPMELLVLTPSMTAERTVFDLSVPTEVSFTPREGGEHLVRLRESAHNRWWGALVVDVAGDRISP